MEILVITIPMDVTSSTTPAKHTMNQPVNSNVQPIIAGNGLVICSVLLMLAIPRLMASCYDLYPETAIHQTTDKLPTNVYEKCIADLTKGLSWVQSADYWQTQAFFYQKLINTPPFQDPPKRRVLLKNAQTAIHNGLALSPIDPFGWFNLASVDNLLAAPTPQIINALRLSFYAERVEPELVMKRLAFSYNFYADFNEDMQQQWQKQLNTAWTFTPGELIKFVVLHPETRGLVLQALVYSPDDTNKFILDLERTLKKPL